MNEVDSAGVSADGGTLVIMMNAAVSIALLAVDMVDTAMMVMAVVMMSKTTIKDSVFNGATSAMMAASEKKDKGDFLTEYNGDSSGSDGG